MYGILARRYDPDFDSCCTVMLRDGTLVTYGFKEVDKALRRLNNKDAYCSLKKNLPRIELMTMLKERKNQEPDLRPLIADMEQLYNANLEKAAIAKQKEQEQAAILKQTEPKLNPKPQKLRKKTKAATKRKAPAVRKRSNKQIPVDTDIAGYYYDMEMQPNHEKHVHELPLVGNGPGKWYRGKIKGERWTDTNEVNYECHFDTPLNHVHWYNQAYAEKAVNCFQDIKVKHGWLSDGDTEPPVHNKVVVGDFVTRWFPQHELPSNFELSDGLRGAYVDAIVLEVVPIKGKNTYKCSFDAPLSLDFTYVEAEIELLRKRYLDRKPPKDPMHWNGVGDRLVQKTLCKGATQRSTVFESCAVVSRPLSKPKIVIKGTQDDVCRAERDVNNDPAFMARAFQEFIKQARVEDVEQDFDVEEDVSGSRSTLGSMHTSTTPPSALYTSGEKALRKRLFPCTVCLQPADGAHQCGRCYAHVHVICAPAFPGSPEGYGQVVLCGKCEGTALRTVGTVGPTLERHTSILSLTENRRRRFTASEQAKPLQYILPHSNDFVSLGQPPPPQHPPSTVDNMMGQTAKSSETSSDGSDGTV